MLTSFAVCFMKSFAASLQITGTVTSTRTSFSSRRMPWISINWKKCCFNISRKKSWIGSCHFTVSSVILRSCCDFLLITIYVSIQNIMSQKAKFKTNYQIWPFILIFIIITTDPEYIRIHSRVTLITIWLNIENANLFTELQSGTQR